MFSIYPKRQGQGPRRGIISIPVGFALFITAALLPSQGAMGVLVVLLTFFGFGALFFGVMRLSASDGRSDRHGRAHRPGA